MIPEKWLFKIAENTKEQFEVLKALTSRNDVTELICATDADREGEMIFRYVYNMIGSNKPCLLYTSLIHYMRSVISLDVMVKY